MLAAKIKLTHACDTDSQRLSLIGTAAKLGRSSLFENDRELFRSVTPGLVTIATWTDSHAAIGIRAAEAGAKVIVCEKPLSSSLSDARKLIDACTAHGTVLITNHERRYDPRYRTAKKLLESGKIGTLRSIHAFLPTGGFRGTSSPLLGGGPLLHDGTHLVDMIRFFAGNLASATGLIRRYGRDRGFEDHAAALLETADGVPVFIEAGGAVGYFGFGIELRGTQGMIKIGNGFQTLHVARPSSLYSGFKDLTETAFPKIPKGNCFTDLYKEAKMILGGSMIDPSSDGNDGYRALETVHAVYLSAKKRKTIAFPVAPKRINIKKIFDL
jgi:predicted dehydrogenase